MRQLDVHKIADEAKFNGFHGVILAWCALIIIFDGYDLAVAGIAMPAIMQEMGVSATQAGFMASSALFGMMFGAIFLGTLADRIGRRRVIAICIVLFSVFTAAAGLTTDPVTFGVLRFIAGLGIGGVMPNVVAEMSEYAPRRMRATLVALMFSGYAVGGMLAALLGKAMIASYGWQSVFYAALAPVVLIPFILRSLPESMPFLLRVGRFEELKAIVARIDPGYRPLATDRFALPAEDRSDKAPVHHLFSEGRAFSTVMLWVAFFMCLFMIYALSTWLTKLMATAGYSLGSAMSFVLVLNLGAIIGAVGGGWLADRFRIKRVLIEAARPADADAIAVPRRWPGRCQHHRHPDRDQCLCGTVLPPGDPLHRPGLGAWYRSHRSHPRADPDWRPGRHVPAPGAELRGDRTACAVCGTGHRSGEQQGLRLRAPRRRLCLPS